MRCRAAPAPGRLRGCACSRSPTSATPGPGVFAEAVAGRRARARPLARGRGDEPPADPFAYGAVMTFGGAMHADQDDRHPWLRAGEGAPRASCSSAGVPLLGVCLGSQLLAEAAGGRARARRASPRSAGSRSRSPSAGRADPLIGPLAPRFEAFQWHSYEVEPPPGGDGARADARLRPGLPARRASAGGSSSTPRSRAADARNWIDDYRADEDAVRIGVDPERLGRRDRRRGSRPSTSSAASSARRSWLAAAAYSRSPASGRRRRARRRR